ncbi:arginine vasopressin-induced protein 1 [Periophthalmus magnuspinnatus]|uniref:arginine vasopressin-induced protein 1 n=1 Tax=Periophthalmus magnuspinnatus TaxID=409849 RepID=UPI00145BA8E0|nr:arginine vasopressin-induced protein 1 [Periophthalmus magnuspinnatus]
MPPSPVLVWMDSGAAPPAASSGAVMAGPSSVWRLADRRSRKAGSANIFSSVHLWQLQRLFRAAGDQDAEQRAQLVWGRGDEAELAQALIALRARGQKRGLRSRGRDALGAHWIKAFNHLRIGDSSQSPAAKSPEHPCGKPESDLHHTPTVDQGWDCPSPPGPREEPVVERPGRSGGAGIRRGGIGGGEADPDRYLHRILH